MPLEDQIEQRRANFEALTALGVPRFPHAWDPTANVSDIVERHGARTAEELEANPSQVNHAAATVDASYFRALRIPLVRGRTFGAHDATRPSDEVVVSRAFAERYWPGASPLGGRVRAAGGVWHTVVGEVGDVHYDALDRPAREMVYFPIAEPAGLSLVVRTDSHEGEALSAIRGGRRAVAPVAQALATL